MAAEDVYVGISARSSSPGYLAAGIFGQAQHMTGVRDAKVIVSVNKDEKRSDPGLSDTTSSANHEVLPALAQAFRDQ